MMTTIVLTMVTLWQHVVFDPSPMCDALICDNARWPKSCSGSHWRADLYQRTISGMSAGLQCPAMPDRAECQASTRASCAANSYACARPCGFLFE